MLTANCATPSVARKLARRARQILAGLDDDALAPGEHPIDHLVDRAPLSSAHAHPDKPGAPHAHLPALRRSAPAWS